MPAVMNVTCLRRIARVFRKESALRQGGQKWRTTTFTPTHALLCSLNTFHAHYPSMLTMNSLCNSLKCSILMPQPVTGYILAIQLILQTSVCDSRQTVRCQSVCFIFKSQEWGHTVDACLCFLSSKCVTWPADELLHRISESYMFVCLFVCWLYYADMNACALPMC